MQTGLPRSWKDEFALAVQREQMLHREKKVFFAEQERKRRKDNRLEDQREDADTLMATETVLASSEEIAAYRVDLSIYDAATVEALMDNQDAIDAVRRKMDTMLAEAQILPDGRRVFKTKDGMRVFDEYGSEGDALTWSLSGGGGKFDIVTRNGMTRLVVDGALDYENNSSYSVNLTASDGALETSQSFTIKVADVVDLVKGNGNANTLSGASGADLIRDPGGNDKLYGGARADAFVFATGDTAKGKVSADIIYDFRAGQGDVIDLTGYDANAKKFGNQDFDFQATIVSGVGNVAR